MHSSIDMDNVRLKRGKHTKRERRVGFPLVVTLELESVWADHIIKTDAEENKRRRAIILTKTSATWGFTLQSYGIRYKKEKAIQHLTYVDYVDHGGPAHLAGMRSGDVILSINGESMEERDHASLVSYIKGCEKQMRMVVLFEDCVRKIELHMRYLRLQRVLTEKMFELRSLETVENRILDSSFNRTVWKRQSLTSYSSSLDSSWDDRLSLMPELDRCPSPLFTASSQSVVSHFTEPAVPKPHLAASASYHAMPTWQNESFRSDSVVVHKRGGGSHAHRSLGVPRELRWSGGDRVLLSQSCSDFSQWSSEATDPPGSADSVFLRSHQQSASGFFAFHPSISPKSWRSLSDRLSEPLNHYLDKTWSVRTAVSVERGYWGHTSTPIMETEALSASARHITYTGHDSACSDSDISAIHLELNELSDELSITELSSAGFESRSDSSAVELQLINETDECTRL